MSWVTKTLKSSIGRKLIMGGSGLLLCVFLIAHLGGNMLMYVGPDAYNLYAHTLHSQEWLVKTLELGLVVLFGLHIWLALETNKDNREARNSRYAVRQSKIPERKIPFGISPENWMFVSGVVVLGFLILHLLDFTLNVTHAESTAGKEPFDKAMIILRNPITTFVYLAGVGFLGWHLMHAVTSMFQTLGIKHPRYNPLLNLLGPVFAVAMFVGFASLPIYAWISDYDPHATPSSSEHASYEEGHDDVESH